MKYPKPYSKLVVYKKDEIIVKNNNTKFSKIMEYSIIFLFIIYFSILMIPSTIVSNIEKSEAKNNLTKEAICVQINQK